LDLAGHTRKRRIDVQSALFPYEDRLDSMAGRADREQCALAVSWGTYAAMVLRFLHRTATVTILAIYLHTLAHIVFTSESAASLTAEPMQHTGGSVDAAHLRGLSRRL
jgi:hypothetical protein